MFRTQIQLPEQFYEILREKAHREKTSISALIRRGIEWVLAEEKRSDEEKRRRALAAVGRFNSGDRDVSEKHDDYLDEIYGK